MKRLFILFAAGCMFACNNEKKNPDTLTVTTEDGTTVTTASAEALQKAAAQMQARQAELEKLTPHTGDELKAMIPESLLGNARTEYSVNSANGAIAGEAVYKINDSTELELDLVDCAGPAGAGIYSLQFIGLVTQEMDNEEKFAKTSEVNGTRVYEQYDKIDKESQLTYMAANRYLVHLEGKNLPVDALKQAMRDLKFK